MKSNLVYIIPRIELSIYNEIEYRIDQVWFDYCIKLGVNPILLTNKNLLHDYKYKPLAVFMIGGGDISIIKSNKLNKLRDKRDLEIYKFLKSKKMKIISICRSSQLLLTNIYKFNISRSSNHVRKNHKIYNNSYSLNVNSFHNYCLKGDLSKFSEYLVHKDGSIEYGIDNKRKNLLLMFHPERKNIDQNIINKKLLNFMK